MKRLVSLFMTFALMLTLCAPGFAASSTEDNSSLEMGEVAYSNLNDPAVLQYMEDSVYEQLVSSLDSEEYFVDNVEAVYISKEYIEELTYNSRGNVFFGYTIEDVENAFQGERYVFTVGEDGKTTVKAFEKYDDTFEQVLKNVAIGSGVIVLCVTVSVLTGGAAPAVSMIFAASAKTGAIMALSSGVLSGAVTAAVTGIQTHDINQAFKEGALSASQSFKWGAIGGAVAGGAGQAMALHGATLNGLTMNQAAAIQKESKYPLSVIKQFHSTEEYEVFKAAHLKSQMVNGKLALVRSDIDLKLVDEMGRTNLARMQKGLAPLDSYGNAFELHHIGQEMDATLAILTSAEHDSAALHGFTAVSKIDRPAFKPVREAFWRTMARLLEKGAIAI